MLKMASQSVSFEAFEHDLRYGALPTLDCLFLKAEYKAYPFKRLIGLYTAKKAALCLLPLKNTSYLDLFISFSQEDRPQITLMSEVPNLISLDVAIIESASHVSAIAIGRFSA